MEDHKLLSIIIPVHNLGKHIIRTLDSLVKQDLTKSEILIIDDGSIDDTVKIAEKTLEKYTGIDYQIIKKTNGGVSSARNRGIDEASGKYIYFLDGDDYVSNNFIEVILQYIENKAPDILCWGYDKVTVDNKILTSYFNRYKKEVFTLNGVDALYNIIINKKLSIWTGSAIYKKQLLLKYNLLYTKGCIAGEDLEFTFKALVNATEVVFIDKILSFYVHREGSITNSFHINKFDAVCAMQRVYEYIKQSSNPKLEEMANIFQEFQVINHYILNLYSFYRYSEEKGIKKMRNEVDKAYPGLSKDVNILIRQYKGRNIKDIIRVKLFSISPKFYFNLLNLKVSLNKRKLK